MNAMAGGTLMTLEHICGLALVLTDNADEIADAISIELFKRCQHCRREIAACAHECIFCGGRVNG
jgi:hypothetical protein